MAINQLPMPIQGQQGNGLQGAPQLDFWQKLFQFFLGHQGYNVQQSTATPQQMQSSNFLGQWGQNQVQNPYAGFEPIANKLNNQWSQNVVPSLAARFSGLGDNKTTSGAFTQQLQGSNNQLQDIIGSLMSNYGQQNKQQGLGAIQQSLNPQFENQYFPSQQGFLQNFLFNGLENGKAALGTAGKAYTGGI